MNQTEVQTYKFVGRASFWSLSLVCRPRGSQQGGIKFRQKDGRAWSASSAIVPFTTFPRRSIELPGNKQEASDSHSLGIVPEWLGCSYCLNDFMHRNRWTEANPKSNARF
jgi:hypothetical protein